MSVGFRTVAMPDVDEAGAGETTSTRLDAQFADAFDGLYRRAYQSAFKLLGDRNDAEDVAQEACTRACLRWSRLDNPTRGSCGLPPTCRSIVGAAPGGPERTGPPTGTAR